MLQSNHRIVSLGPSHCFSIPFLFFFYNPLPQLEFLKKKSSCLIFIDFRGQQVMLDKDLATLYGVETKVLNQTVKRNIERFPNNFRFELSREECLRSQIVTSNGRDGNRYSTYAFTEQGVAMLSSVLRSQTAIEVNIQIMRTFVSMRHFIVNSASVFCRLETIEYHWKCSNISNKIKV